MNELQIHYTPKAKESTYEDQVLELVNQRYDEMPLAYVHSYGCQQNVSDGERLKGLLAVMGYGFTDNVELADLVLFNTCAVRETAQDRVYGNVGALKPLKKAKPSMIIALCGCMMQQDEVVAKIKKSFSYVDIVFGTNAVHQFPYMLFERLSGSGRVFVKQEESFVVEGLPVKREGSVKAWLPIMHGCNNFCSYCIVPYVRGREVSRAPEAILAEAKEILAEGYKDITLLGQNVNSYGLGLTPEVNFSYLLREIDKLDGEFWLRFMTSHPKDCTKELIDTIAASKHICRSIHLPVQSGSNRILAQMNRRYTVEEYLELIDYAREKIPGVTFSSDIIVGFPGETREDFLLTLELIKRVKYNVLYTFIYSKRSGTVAAKMEDPISSKEKSKWFRELLALQEEISYPVNRSLIGQTIRVLVDSKGKSGDDYIAGRNESGTIVEFEGSMDLIGRFVDVKITRAMNWAVFGELL